MQFYKTKILSYILLNLIFKFIFVLYLLIQICLGGTLSPAVLSEKMPLVLGCSLCRSNGTHFSSITVRWHRWKTEGEKAFVDDRENGKRKREEGEHVLSLADVITRWRNRGEDMGSGLPETAVM